MGFFVVVRGRLDSCLDSYCVLVSVDVAVDITVDSLDSVGDWRWHIGVTVDLQSSIGEERTEDSLAVLEVVMHEIHKEILVHHVGNQLSAWRSRLVDLCPLASELKGLVLTRKLSKSHVP